MKKIEETGNGRIKLGKYGACYAGKGCYNFVSEDERQTWLVKCEKEYQDLAEYKMICRNKNGMN